MFWHYNHPWNAFNKFVIVYYKTLGTAFAVIWKHLSWDWCIFLQIFAVYGVWKIGPDVVKRRKGSLASGKTLVWPILSQNLIHTDIELGWLAKHQTDPLLVQPFTVINAY